MIKKFLSLITCALCALFLLSIDASANSQEDSLLKALDEMSNLSELEAQAEESEGIEKIILQKAIIILRDIISLFKDIIIYLLGHLLDIIKGVPETIQA